MHEAIENRDSLAKTLYSRLFLYLLHRINQSISRHASASASASSLPTTNNDNNAEELYIAILDIYGFESFSVNSLEQLCINMANEKLHQLFIDLLFRGSQQEYQQEGLPVPNIKFEDNQGTIHFVKFKNADGWRGAASR